MVITLAADLYSTLIGDACIKHIGDAGKISITTTTTEQQQVLVFSSIAIGTHNITCSEEWRYKLFAFWHTNLSVVLAPPVVLETTAHCIFQVILWHLSCQ